MSFISLARFIPRYFTVFGVMVSGSVFLISFSVRSLLAYKSATDLWTLIFYPATLLNSFISSSTFLMESLGFSMYNTMSSANKDSFTSSIPSSYLIAMAGTSNTMLNKRCESRYPCFVPYVKGNACNFCPLSMMLAVGL